MEKQNSLDNSRTNNFLRNSFVGILTQFISLILSFVSRTIFIKMLSNEYLSINGLFSNVLSTLSFVELGFGVALIYMMYKPVADKDKEKIKTLVKYYQKVYFIIGIAIFLLGLLVIPFFRFIIKEEIKIKENLILIYIIFLINTCIGYFYSHKVAIINAHQQNYIIAVYSQIFKWLQLIIQIVVLLFTKNFILYLLVMTSCTLLNNLAVSIKANKMFPYLKEKNVAKISPKEKKSISNSVKSLIFYRLNPSILNGSDNIILSACVGITSVGLYSNYYLITNYLNMFLSQITSSLESSIGNLNTINDKEKKENVFYKTLFLCFFMYGIICVLLMALLNNFITIWLKEEYLLDSFTVFTILLFIYMNGLSFTCYSFRTTSGLFEKAKLVPLFEVILNVIISIILAYPLKMAGVFLGTSIAKLLTFFWTDPKLLYTYLFEKKNMYKYFLKYLKYLLITLGVGFIIFYLSNMYMATNYIYWLLKAICLGLLTLVLFILLTFRSMEFKGMIEIIKNMFNKRKARS